jgi:hypothetical protein
MDRRPLRQYLVERYVPGATDQDLRAMSRSLAKAADELAAAGQTVRYIGSTHVPVEDSCFSWFLGSSEDVVRRVLEAAAVPYARILATQALLP